MEIPLTNSPLKAVIDDEDSVLVSTRKWCLVNGHALSTSRPYIFMHHLINGRPPKGFETDHKDQNPLNNCRYNLRNATRTQNQQNAKRRKDNSSGFKGVRKASLNRWWACIKVNGEDKYLGCFKTAQEAARAYDEAAKKYFGEFAGTNGEMGESWQVIR